MAIKSNGPDFDVVIVGSGVAGALLAHRLAKARLHVLILEAGDFAPHRGIIQNNWVTSPLKTADSPFPDPIVAPQPREATGGREYYIENIPKPAPGDPNPVVPFISYYERLVGGSTWHWQGLNIRMLPNDFKLKSTYGLEQAFDWPISYDDLERWYCEAEYEMGTAGSDADAKVYAERFKAYRSRPFPMRPLAPSYLDKWFADKLNGKVINFGPDFPDLPQVSLIVTAVPHAINSREYDDRPACDGRGTCVPFCPTRARYEASVHIDKARAAGAKLISKAMVYRLEAGADNRISRVTYRTWDRTDHSVSGRIVVLAANAVENPKILLLSRDQQHPSGLANGSGKVGLYLMDHPIKSSYALAPEPLYPFRGPQTTSDIGVLRDGDFRKVRGAFKTSIKNDGWSGPTAAPRGRGFPFRNPDGSWNIAVPDEDWKPAGSGMITEVSEVDDVGTLVSFVNQWNLFGTELRKKLEFHCTRQITLNTHCEMLPIASNRVGVSDNLTDRFGIPRPTIHFTVDDPGGYTRASFEAIIQFHRQVFAALGATSVHLGADPKDKGLNFVGAGHLIGTTLMGSDRTTSVVDADCRSHDHPNLFILGSSVFPTGSTANPTLTIAAIALRAAEKIKMELHST